MSKNFAALLTKLCQTPMGQTIKLSKSDARLLLDYQLVRKNKNNEFTRDKYFKAYEGKVVRCFRERMIVKVAELENDLTVYYPLSGTAVINDTVKIWHFPDSYEGFIEKVISRGQEEFVGKLSFNYDPHVDINLRDFFEPVFLEKDKIIGQPNDIVLVRITDYQLPLKGEIVKILGNINNPGVDILAKIYEANVPYEFSAQTIESLEDIPLDIKRVTPQLKADRQDYRDRLIVTIDGADAKDFDDAIEVEKTKKGYRLGVHIADVTHYVTKGSPLDKDALARGTSIYLADRVIPMLPFKLSNGICSLNPHVTRLTMSCIVEFDDIGNILNYEITPSIIKSKHRLTYDEVNNFYQGTHQFDDKLATMLTNAKELATLIRQQRNKKGSIELNIDEAKLIVDENGKVTDIVKRVQGVSERLIEDFMVTANEVVAAHIYHLDLPFIYRIHDMPSKDKLQQLVPLLKNLGFVLNAKNGIHPNQLQKLINESSQQGLERVVSQFVLRSLAKAKYSEENIGHFGLGSDIYTHFTSPIRRYPDLLVHRLLKLYRGDISKINLDKLLAQVASIAEANSISERKAIDLERAVTSMKMAEYMEDHIGEEYIGRVCGIIESGFFVVLDNLVEGMIRYESINYDYFDFVPSKMQAYGRNTNRIIRLGQEFEVRVVNASKSTGRVEFVLASYDTFKNAPVKGRK